MKTFDLWSVKVRSGEEHREEVELELAPLEYGGERYVPIPETVPMQLAVTRASTGTVFGLRFRTTLHGPCYRCLADAALDVDIGTRGYRATNPGEEERRTAALEDSKLDVQGWARDAITLSLPEQILCRPDCAGLCPVCSKDLKCRAARAGRRRRTRAGTRAKLRDEL